MATLAETWQRLPRWQRALLVALDKYVNMRTGGVKGQTVSERLARDREQHGRAGRMGCALLDAADPGHCDRALKFPSKPVA